MSLLMLQRQQELGSYLTYESFTGLVRIEGYLND